MQLPSALRDWLMFLASSSVAPVAPERPTRSLPARSTRLSWLTLLRHHGEGGKASDTHKQRTRG